MAAKGRAEISEEGEWQRVLVEVTAKVVDGTVLTLILNGEPVASIVISRSEGVFEFATSKGERLRSEVEVGQIETIEIATKEGVLVLTGRCAEDDGSQ